MDKRMWTLQNLKRIKMNKYLNKNYFPSMHKFNFNYSNRIDCCGAHCAPKFKTLNEN